MSVRKKPQDRCPRCLMRREACLCHAIPLLETRTKIVVVISKREYNVPTNTGRLAGLALAKSVILQRGHPDQPIDLQSHLGPTGTNLLVYPGDNAEVLCPVRESHPGPYTLVFPDSNWRGAVKMCRRDPVMASLPMVRLPAGSPSGYLVRKETKSGGLATLEAIARALGIVESPEIQIQLEDLLKMMVSRTMASRGYLNDR